ncbi:MerR family transcriptional regulator [Alicyclobacillaceae bacterium I2511]|nr:MerR family transcriptional regulator [Alicyclobacillaceae bacterium I2511]
MELSERKQLPLFGIGVVQKLTGLSARQIRYYEQHDLIQPARTDGNQRLFSFHDVERLLLVRDLLDQGYNMVGVKARLSHQGKDVRKVPRQEPSDEELFRRIQADLMDRWQPHSGSEFQGDLSRFYRKS